MSNIKKNKCTFYLGILIIFILSSVFHFLYSFTDIFFFSFFSAVDESVFEHIKITYFAALFYTLFLYYNVFDQNKSAIAGAFFGLSFVYIFIPTVFYGYKNILGENNTIIDIAITFFAGVGYLATTYLFVNKMWFNKQWRVFAVSIIILTGLTILFTYYKPDFNLFIPNA